MKKLNYFYTDIDSFFISKKNTEKKRILKIYSLLRVDNTFMTTAYNRMFDVNQILKKYIKKFFTKKIVVCDFGISSGQSTLELYDDLIKLKIKKIYGFDKQIYLKIYRIKNLIFLFNSSNELLMVEYKKHCLRYRYFLMFKKIEKFLVNLFNLFNIKSIKSELLMPNLNRLDNCKFYEQDIFNIKKKYYNFFDVIRISNLLNYSYFSEEKLKKAILNIKKISKENCIISINRTPINKKKNSASFFIKKNGKFELLEDLNGGSELKKLMLMV